MSSPLFGADEGTFARPAASRLTIASPPALSVRPSDDEVRRSRVFPEALIPVGNHDAEKNDALAAALKLHGERWARGGDDASAITDYVGQNPGSKWNISLLTNLGLILFKEGRFSSAMDAWEQAWKLGREESDPAIKPVVDRAVGELAKMNARIGRFDRLETLMAELKGRPLTGAATELVVGAAEGLWLMKNRPERAFLCGPSAVGKLSACVDLAKALDERIITAVSTQRGTSLNQVCDLARAVGLDYQMARRDPGAKIILPAIVNWKVGHWAALTDRADGRILVDDPTFGETLWVREPVLDAEASGYFLVPAGPLPPGWRAVDSAEGDQVWGKGTTSSTDDDACRPCDEKSSGGCSAGMAVARGHLAIVSLNIEDTPLFYSPPRGDPIAFTATYNQRDAGQPTTFYYSNLGPKWTFGWMSYVEDNPSQRYNDVKLYVQGGGRETYRGFSSSDSGISGAFSPNKYSHAKLTRMTSGGYERILPDGTKETYGVADGPFSGGTGPLRRVFLSQITDPQGNSTTFSYDTSGGMFRLTSVKDDLEQTTTLAYTLPGDPLKITKVTDPFNRSATFEYTGGRLSKITDMIGITSQFLYSTLGTGDFISSLTTPYGTSQFAYADKSTDNSLATRTRWLELTDPMGGKERIEFNELYTGTNVSDFVPNDHDKVVSSVIPAGMYSANAYMYARNTFYWSKKAMMDAPGDYSAAHVYHWLHGNSLSQSGSIVESEKAPLENRVWYGYPGQPEYPGSGPVDNSAMYLSSNVTLDHPSVVGRVMDDGSTQLNRRTYNSFGLITKEVDPLGRTTVYQYAANNLDLTAIYQVNPAGTSSVVVDGVSVAADRLMAYADYNALHEPQTVTDAAGQVTTYTYNAKGQKLTQTVVRNGQNETTTWNYVDGYLMSVTGPVAGSTTTFTYDGFGRMKTVTGPDEYKLTYGYDALNRLIRTTFPDGTFTQTIYDRLDPAWERDRLGRWTRRTYDALRRVVAVTDPENDTTQFDWCNCGALKGIIDARDNRTSFTQDIQGRLKTKTYADTKGLVYTYENKTSRLKSVLDAKSQTTTYGYNLDDTPVTVTYSNAQYATPNVSFTYDPRYRRLASMTDGTGTTQYAYKPAGSLGAIQLDTVDGPLANDTVAYTYDELGRVLSAKVNGTGNTVSYDALGRLATAANPLGAFGYFYVGQTARLDYATRPGGQTVDYSYFGNTGDNRISEINNLGPSAAALSKFNYTYDAVGNIRKWTQQAGVAGAQYYDLGYDRTGQLLTAFLRDAATGAMVKPYTYRYDAAGNRVSEQVDNGVMTATVNSLNQITGIAAGGAMTLEGTVGEPATVTVAGQAVAVDANQRFRATVAATAGSNSVPIVATDGSGNVTSKTAQFTVSSLGAASPTYDYNGNQTWDGTKGYEWDAANRLVAITYGSPYTSRTEISYDGMGRRAQIVEKTGTTVTSTKRFVWIGNDVAEERDGSNNVTRRFFGEGEQIGGTAYLFTRDHLGSVREMVDVSGAVQARYAYDPYGRRTKVSGSLEADFGFTGHYYHAPSQLHLALYRAYDAGKGRWISRDPIGESGGVNLYGYVLGNPVNLWDPLGLKPGDEYKCMDQAGIWAVYDINDKSQREGIEYAGTIYQNANGTYSYTSPNPGTVDESTSGPIPSNTKAVAGYHTHPAAPGYNESENFSITDMNLADGNGPDGKCMPEYLGTPSRKIKKYTPNGSPWKGRVETIWKPKAR